MARPNARRRSSTPSRRCRCTPPGVAARPGGATPRRRGSRTTSRHLCGSGVARRSSRSGGRAARTPSGRCCTFGTSMPCGRGRGTPRCPASASRTAAAVALVAIGGELLPLVHRSRRHTSPLVRDVLLVSVQRWLTNVVVAPLTGSLHDRRSETSAGFPHKIPRLRGDVSPKFSVTFGCHAGR